MPAHNAAREILARFLEQRGVDSDGAVEALEDYEGLIRRWSARGNLVSRRDMGRLRNRHVLDSLSLLPWWRGTLLDVGSGAGFPGVPLAIARPASPVTLVERSERKARFLRQVVIELGLCNVEVIEADVGRSRAWCSLGGRVFDTVTARAVAPPTPTWRLLRDLLAPAGVALLQSGDPPDASLFDGGEIRVRERMAQGWVTVVGRTAIEQWRGG